MLGLHVHIKCFIILSILNLQTGLTARVVTLVLL